MKLGGLVVVASNAGGAWTPMGTLAKKLTGYLLGFRQKGDATIIQIFGEFLGKEHLASF